MVRINEKSIDDFLIKAQETLQNSLIETGYSFTYNTGTLSYVLPGFATDNERIYAILSIEGTGFLPEDYLTEDNLIEETDYSLWDNYSIEEKVPDGYGTSSGKQVFTGITIADQTFKDNSIVHLKYKYQNPNYIPLLTNFSPNSILRMILTATLLNIQETNEELTQSMDAFGLDAGGEDLDRIATMVGLTRTTAVTTEGSVKIFNNSTTSSYGITTGHRFAAIAGGKLLGFAAAASVTIQKNQFKYVKVKAVEAGSYYNVGSNSISLGFTNVGMTAPTPSTIAITNPPLLENNDPNLFNNGTDEETDDDFRKRVSVTFSQAKTSSHSTIEKAVIDTNLTSYVRVYDIETKKDLAVNHVQSFIATENGVRLDATTLTTILDAIKAVKPSGSLPTIKQTLNTFINFDINIYVDSNSIGDTTTLNLELIELLDEYINTKEIGEDILPSAVVSLLKGVNEVLDIEINSHTITEFASEAPTYAGKIEIITADVEQNWIGLEMPLNSATHLHSEVESGIGGDILDLAASGLPYPVDERTLPRVNNGVIGYDGSVRATPLDIADYYSSGDESTIGYTPDVGFNSGDGIADTDLVLFNYNYFDNTLVDGFRIRFGGDLDNTISVQLEYGSSPDASSPIGSAVIVTLDGTERLYDVPLPTQLELDDIGSGYSPDASIFWLIIKDDSGTGNSWLPVDDQQTPIAFNPATYEDADADGISWTDPGDTISQKRANWHSYTTYTDANAYKKIVIPSVTDEPEKPISYTHTLNFSLFVEE